LSKPLCYSAPDKMNHVEKQQPCVFLRAQGWSFARIGQKLENFKTYEDEAFKS